MNRAVNPAIMSMLAVGIAASAVAQTPPVMPKTQTPSLPQTVELPPPPGGSPDVPNKPLTANEAVLIALKKQPSIAGARAGIAAAGGRTHQVKAGLLPQVTTSLGYTHAQTLAGTGVTGGSGGLGGGGGSTGVSFSFPGVNASAFVRQLIFDFNHTREEVRASAELERAAGSNLTRVQSDTALSVKSAFYTYVQNRRLLKVNESNVANQQEHLALAQARLKSGLGLPSDVVRAETSVSEALLNLSVSRNDASISRVNLARQMGVDPRTPINVSDSTEPPGELGEVNALVDQAVKRRPEVLQAQANLRSAEHGVSAAKTNDAPVLSGNLGVNGRDNAFPPKNESATIGASISWNPFDGGLTAGKVKEARASVEFAKSAVESARLTVISDVSQAYLNLLTAEQRIDTANAEVGNAEEGVRLTTGRFRSGLGTFIEVTDAQAALLTAQTNRVNAQSAIDQARAALAHAIGSPVGK